MKHFFQAWSTWWFATMVPAYRPLTTIVARENMRKRRLQSIIVFLSFIITLLMAILYSFNALALLVLFCCAEDCFLLFALWLNQRGHMELASVVFFVSETLLVLLTTHAMSPSNPHIMSWTFFPIVLLLAGAGIFLPPWIVFLMALGENLLLFWYLLVICHDQLMQVSSQELKSLLTFLCVSIYVSAAIGAFYAVLTKKAIMQADRAVELEQAHQSLTDAHTHLEKIYSDLEAAHKQIQKQALTDGLTGLPNHRAVVEQLEKELDRARRYRRPFSLLFFDADRFKHINDVYGHGTGDAVLRQIGERVGSILRGGDTLGRFGGEEFVLLLPETDAEEARMVAERVRAAIANEPMVLEDANSVNTTVSVGVATYQADGDGQQELLQQADQAMYMAKRLGRNQVRTAIEAVRMSADVELMVILQKEGQHEGEEREGSTPERIRESYTVKIISSLMNLLERRDHGMGQHAYVVSDLATSIAQAMGLEPFQVSRIGMAALLHDIGKVAIPDLLLLKTGRLTLHERALLNEHAELGAQILEASPFLHDLMPAVHHHHERWDGNGYPDHLAGEDIPLAARIIAVAEAYDSMVRITPIKQAALQRRL
jgi:diguanylate cyclase (GGDEF)-like protein/putative nucleotidyltransferase with HDIG domain